MRSLSSRLSALKPLDNIIVVTFNDIIIVVTFNDMVIIIITFNIILFSIMVQFSNRSFTLFLVDLPETFDLFISYLRKIWSNEDFELHIFDTRDFHVSISRTVPIRHHWIKPLTKLLEHGFHGKRR